MLSKIQKNKSVYIHIPFCNTICSYCDFCKFLKNDKWVDLYLNELEKEISLMYKGENINTLYIGGGTPSSLNIKQLKKLFEIVYKFKKTKNIEFTFECNIENIDEEKLNLLYENGVNRLSIGVQTFNDKFLKYLNRNHNEEIIKEKINLAKKIGFKNINIDLMYALKGQTIKDLKDDLDKFLDLNITHISTYSLIIEPHTKLYIDDEENIEEELDYEMYNSIINTLKDKGYNHYEISNFAKDGYESRHNLTYWNNQEYYGFGLGASGYIDNIRYDNTRSFNEYIKGNYVLNKHKLSIEETIENEFILGLRKINGIKKEEFYKKYKLDIKTIKPVNKLLKEQKLLENKKNVFINSKYIYTSNDILIEFIN